MSRARAICRTPIDLAGFNDVNGEELGRALVGKLPGAAAWREGGVEPEVFAAEQGYGSAAAMARDIIDSPTPEERVRQLVDKRQAEHDALFDADEYLFGREPACRTAGENRGGAGSEGSGCHGGTAASPGSGGQNRERGRSHPRAGRLCGLRLRGPPSCGP